MQNVSRKLCGPKQAYVVARTPAHDFETRSETSHASLPSLLKPQVSVSIRHLIWRKRDQFRLTLCELADSPLRNASIGPELLNFTYVSNGSVELIFRMLR